MEIIALIWSGISFVIKAIVYLCYFFPLIGARILQWLDLWPTVWPFGFIV